MWREQLERRFPELRLLSQDCFVVGGAIRDLLFGIEPADADIACRSPLDEAKKISPRVIRLGDETHLSAWRVVHGPHVYDFAELLEGDIGRDLARRDFTVNAMAVDLGSGALFDPHGGRHDVASRLVRMVDVRNFDDDPLRILKGIRMAVRYGMEIENETFEAMRERAPRIADVAVERVTYELSIILTAGATRRAVRLLHESALAPHLGLNEATPAADGLSLAASYALLIADPPTHAKEWRWSRELLREVLALRSLAASHNRLELFDAGEAIAEQLPALLRAMGRDDRLDLPDFEIKPALSGEEIAQLTGLPPGPMLGRVKRELVEAQVMGNVQSREEAEAMVRRLAIKLPS